jgi:hypothetical protein
MLAAVLKHNLDANLLEQCLGYARGYAWAYA